MNPQQQEQLKQLQQQLQQAGRRLLLLVEGDAHWTRQAVAPLLQCLAATAQEQDKDVMPGTAAEGLGVLWCSSRAPQDAWVLPADKLNHELGREACHAVFDLYSGFHADALAALAGNIRAGGFLILLCPPLPEWSVFRDPLVSRIAVQPWGEAAVKTAFASRAGWLLQQYPHKLRYHQCDGLQLCSLPALAVVARLPDAWGCLTPDQGQAVAAVMQVAQGHRRRPLVLEADRGRGKSAAMGIAVAALLRSGKQVLVTAPRQEQVATLLQFAHAGSGTETTTGSVTFVAPDHLLATRPRADLLLVDEAAAIAPGLLQQMLKHWSRVVLATTVNGYEGTGRGFAIRFRRYLDQTCPGWVHQTLSEPVRWQQQDWLEEVTEQLLLLRPQAGMAAAETGCATADPTLPSTGLQFAEFHYATDVASEQTLNQIFELLISAHYRTRPMDLRSLLDGSNIRVFTLHDGDQPDSMGNVRAVAMIAREGELPAALHAPIMQGQRRPHGQVLAQSLAAQLGEEGALTLTHWRVVRIAVQPGAQNLGLGSQLLLQLIAQARQEGIDCIGSVFSGDQRVLGFWQSNGFTLARVGYSREATTGQYSLLVLQGLTQTGVDLAGRCRQQLVEDLPLLLQGSHQQLEPDLVLTLAARFPVREPFHERDQLAVARYVAGYVPYENVAASLWRWFWAVYPALNAAREITEIEADGRRLLVMKLLQNHPWPHCIELLSLLGIKQARQILRDTVALFYHQCYNSAD